MHPRITEGLLLTKKSLHKRNQKHAHKWNENEKTSATWETGGTCENRHHMVQYKGATTQNTKCEWGNGVSCVSYQLSESKLAVAQRNSRNACMLTDRGFDERDSSVIQDA